MKNNLKILCLDIETFPCEVWAWGLGEQNIPLEFLKRDWSVCAWAAHWVGTPKNKIVYRDNRGKFDVFNDKALISELIDLINEADIVLGQNVKHFDIRKLAARAVYHKLPPFNPVKVIDILTEERKVFAFTSHKLAYKTETVNETFKKLTHDKFPGFSLWKSCMKDNKEAWKEMETYCKHDVLSTEEHYLSVQGWIKTHHLGILDGNLRCRCGSLQLEPRGFNYTDTTKKRKYQCKECKKWTISPVNEMTKEQKQSRLREVG